MNSRCPHFDSHYCVSCTQLAYPRNEELAKKQQRIERLTESFASRPQVFPIFSPATVLPSRTKAKLQVTGTVDNPRIGLVQFENGKISAKSLLDCPLHLDSLNELLQFLEREGIQQAGLAPYDLETHKGELKGLVLIANAEESEIILRFVSRSRAIEHRLRKYLPTLLEKFPKLKVVSLNIQPVHQAVVEGPEEIILTSDETIAERYPGFQLEFGPQSFKQVTYESAKALYLRAKELASQSEVEFLLDLYCGTGGFSLALAPVVKRALGVELSEDAVQCARRQAVAWPHLMFQTADADVPLESFFDQAPDLLLVNPPRRGLSEILIRNVLEAGPRRMLYSSCNPETLERDLRLLERRYKVLEFHPFDMFPQTSHLEVLCLLQLDSALSPGEG